MGPFVIIAHGCGPQQRDGNYDGYEVTDYTITAGFALIWALFFRHQMPLCRVEAGCAVVTALVVTVRALKMHGGVPKTDLTAPNVDAREKGIVNLKNIENIKNSVCLW